MRRQFQTSPPPSTLRAEESTPPLCTGSRSGLSPCCGKSPRRLGCGLPASSFMIGLAWTSTSSQTQHVGPGAEACGPRCRRCIQTSLFRGILRLRMTLYISKLSSRTQNIDSKTAAAMQQRQTTQGTQQHILTRLQSSRSVRRASVNCRSVTRRYSTLQGHGHMHPMCECCKHRSSPHLWPGVYTDIRA